MSAAAAAVRPDGRAQCRIRQQRLRWDQTYEMTERRRALEDKGVDVLTKAVDDGDTRIAINVAEVLWK
jgi:hypothetical protein